MMRLFVFVVLAVIAFEVALASSDKERYRFPDQRIGFDGGNSRIIDMRGYIKNMWKNILNHIDLPVIHRKGFIFGRRQHWDIKYGK